MLIDDGISGLWEVRDMNMAEILRSSQFKSLYQLHYVSLALYWKVFGSNSQAYFIWFMCLQGLLATLMYIVLPKLVSLFKIEKTNFLFFLLGLLFICSPHNIENFAWAATSHYVLAFVFYFALLHYLVKALGAKEGSIFWFYFFFVLSLFTMEISLLFPLSVTAIIGALYFKDRDKNRLKRFLVCYALPLYMGVFLALSLLYFLSDTWVPRGSSNFFSLRFYDAVVNFWNYILQALGYTHYLNVQQRFSLYGTLSTYSFWPGLLLIITAVVVFIRRKNYLLLLVFLHIIIFISPNLFRWGAILFRYENSRFLYFVLPFLLSFILLFSFKKKFLFFSIGLVVLVANLFFLRIALKDKQASGLVHETFIQQFEAYKDKDIYLLNIPNCCTGYQIFRGYNRIRIASDVKHKRHGKEKLKEILWYYALSVKDSFSVQKVDDGRLQIQPRSLGVWLMSDWGGAVSYEDDEIEVEMTEWSGYFVRFKEAIKPTEYILLFSEGQLRDVSHLVR